MAKGERKSGRQRVREDREQIAKLGQSGGGGGGALEGTKRQIRTAAKIAGIALVVVRLVCLSLWSGLDSIIPLIVALVLTIATGVAAWFVQRNLKKSEDMGELLSGAADLSDEEREARLAKLDAQVAKGDAAAVLAKAQLQMQEAPEAALVTLETIVLEKATKLVAAQVRARRGMIHLNLGEVAKARELADAIDLSKSPDAKSRANLAAVVAEAWARSGNPIEAVELLSKYDVDDAEFQELKMPLLRARVFAFAHKNDLKAMKKALKGLTDLNPQLAAMFLSQKRIHPLLQKEARRALEKSGYGPRQKIQMARR